MALSFSRMRPIMGQRLRHLGILNDEAVYLTNRAAVMDLSKDS